MTAPYLLSLADLHAAAPGVLDVVFGPDGDFEGAPMWGCCLWNPRLNYYVNSWYGVRTDFGALCLDLRLPSVAARLMRLCSFVETVDADLSPEALAVLVLAWAPRIAALRTP